MHWFHLKFAEWYIIIAKRSSLILKCQALFSLKNILKRLNVIYNFAWHFNDSYFLETGFEMSLKSTINMSLQHSSWWGTFFNQKVSIFFLFLNNNICFYWEIRKLFTWYPLLSRPMLTIDLDISGEPLQNKIIKTMKPHLLGIVKKSVCKQQQSLAQQFYTLFVYHTNS